MYVLFEKLNYDRKQFDADVRQMKSGTHGTALNHIGIELCKKDYVDYKWYQKTIPEFKKARVCADYHEIAITNTEASDSVNIAFSIINTMKKHFN